MEREVRIITQKQKMWERNRWDVALAKAISTQHEQIDFVMADDPDAELFI